MTRIPPTAALRVSRKRRFCRALLSALACLAASFGPGALAEDSGLKVWPEGGHIRVLDPRDVTREDAQIMYDLLLPGMVEGYAKSGLPEMDYRSFRRLNSHPYVSDQHGARLVNVYVNEQAQGFFAASRDKPLPEGAKIIKDSISAVKSGGIARGPLFIMEKMTKGFAPEFDDWRYTMVMPNGKVFGTTGGEGNAAVKFCAECHVRVADHDSLFELPKDYLAQP